MEENKEKKNTEAEPVQKEQQFLSLPITRLGKWAVGITIVSWVFPLVPLIINILITSLSSGEASAINMFTSLVLMGEITGGLLGVVAVVRKRERSGVVWFVILIGIGALVLALRDLIVAL
jgi:hypothetical protein